MWSSSIDIKVHLFEVSNTLRKQDVAPSGGNEIQVFTQWQYPYNFVILECT